MIYDAVGNVNYIDNNFTSNKTIPVEDLLPGLYFIKITGSGKFFSEKVLVVK